MNLEKEFDELIVKFKQTVLEKNKGYGNSFLDSDLAASYYDIRRKWKRIDVLFKNGKVHEVKDFEEHLDAVNENLKDLSIYGILTMINIKQKGMKND